MIAKRDSLIAGTWSRSELTPERLSPAVVDGWRQQVDGMADDDEVRLPVDVFRALLAAHEQPTTRPGARIRDDERGVTYYATIHRDGEDSRLRTVEVVPDEGVTSESIYRVPVQLLVNLTTEVVAEAEAGYVVMGVHGVPDEHRTPDAAELAALIRAGWNRRKISEEFDRPINTVDQWLRRARQELPDKFPRRKRGPKPTQTPGAAASGDQNGEQTMNGEKEHGR